MDKYKVGDKFFDTKIQEIIEIISVEFNTLHKQYGYKIVPNDTNTTYFDAYFEHTCIKGTDDEILRTLYATSR